MKLMLQDVMNKPMNIEKSKKRTTIYLPVEMHQKLKIEAASEGKSMGELIEEWIRSWKAYQ